ncbi:MAG: HTTM domain-containing protein [Planctomycetaceae bacterium]
MSSPTQSQFSPTAFAQRWVAAWDQFWFTPRAPQTLAVIRIATGLMLLYSHLVVAANLFAFLGDDAWINNQTSAGLHGGAYGPADAARSYLWHLSNPLLLWGHHLLTIVITACFAIGLLTRITAPLAWWLQLMLVHRMTGTLFGLDQITTMLAMYLMLAPCGAVFSLDAIIRRRFARDIGASKRLSWLFPDAQPSVATNIATRLIQLHLCIVYLFGGLWKARGTAWWDGTAIWFAISNAQYQSLDVTWLAGFPRVFSLLAHVTVFWEVFYCALVWPKLTRPMVLAIAVAVHGGIALFLGMITFGTIMIVANFAFVSPALLITSPKRLSSEAEAAAARPG